MTRVIPLTTLAIAVVMTTTAQAATVLITGTTRAESYRIGPEQRRSVDLEFAPSSEQGSAPVPSRTGYGTRVGTTGGRSRHVHRTRHRGVIAPSWAWVRTHRTHGDLCGAPRQPSWLWDSCPSSLYRTTHSAKLRHTTVRAKTMRNTDVHSKEKIAPHSETGWMRCSHTRSRIAGRKKMNVPPVSA